MTILQSVKDALRISHNKLDNEIQEYINAAQHEMIRVGVDEETAMADDIPLVKDAIKVYCLMKNTTDMAKYDRYFESWQYQVDNLRKSSKIGQLIKEVQQQDGVQ